MYQGKEREVDGPASRYVSILPMSFLAFSALLHLHLKTRSDVGKTTDISGVTPGLQFPTDNR